mgnify:CR=1 FL=1
MGGKRKHGQRMPSLALNASVNALTNEEFLDLFDLLNESPRASAFKDLIRWHRGKHPYDPDEEKVAFAIYDLNSLRRVAFRKVQNGIEQLRNGIPNWIDNGITYENDLSAIQKERLHAESMGYFGRQAKLLEIELALCEKALVGINLENEKARINIERLKLEDCIALYAEIEKNRETLDALRSSIKQSGSCNALLVSKHLDSNAFRKDISEFPFLLQCAKLLVDEGFLYLAGKYKEACLVAESISKLNEIHNRQNPIQHAKLLRRLTSYYAELGETEKSRNVIALYKRIDPEKSEYRDIYLKKYLISCIIFDYDTGTNLLENEIIEVCERNKTYLFAHSNEADHMLLLICLVNFYLGIQDIPNAKIVFDCIYQNKGGEKPRLLYQNQYMVAHLILLFEQKDEMRMRQYARNYERFFKKNLPFSTVSYEVSVFLRKQIKIKDAIRFERKKAEMHLRILEFQKVENLRYSFWFQPFLKWFQELRFRSHQV